MNAIACIGVVGEKFEAKWKINRQMTNNEGHAVVAAAAAAYNFKLHKSTILWIRTSIYINTTNIDFGYLFWLTGLKIMSENRKIDLHIPNGRLPKKPNRIWFMLMIKANRHKFRKKVKERKRNTYAASEKRT